MNTMSIQSPDLLIVGGGAAGLMAAGKALKEGLSVTVFEPNERLGRKLSITGKGRCNLTNDCSPTDFLQNVTKNPRFLYSAIYGFTPADCMAFFEGLGVPLKTERGRRVFPVSDRAGDVVNALCRYAKGARVVKAHVSGILTEEGRAVGVTADGREYRGGAVLLATGGASYQKTGSDGSGFRLAKALSHTITPLIPSLVPLESPDVVCKKMQGLSLKNVSLTLTDKNGRTLYRDFGEMLFTHFGISGPMVLSASAHLRGVNISEVTAVIDLKPALDEKTLDNRLLSDLSGQSNRAISNILGGLLPALMIPACLEQTKILPSKTGNSITKEERRRLLSFLKGFSFPLSSFRPLEEAIVTSGGIDTREVEPRSMQSRLVENLYFAGEILDVDAYTGGYNLQIAFATAVAAARAISKKRKDNSYENRD